MGFIDGFFLEYHFLSFFLAWLSACIIKAILASVFEKRPLRLKDGFANGGMPSTHSAAVSSITTAIYYTTGFSPLFYVSLVFSLIVISDAFGIRRNIGVQGEALNKLLQKAKGNPIHVVYGHTFSQVLMGILWGVGFAILMAYAF